MSKVIEIWADSFHEGNWCCDKIMLEAESNGFKVSKSYKNGFQPKYIIKKDKLDIDDIELIVYGSYKSWSPVPQKISNLIGWGKPDFIAYDPAEDKLLFAVEETAATATGNQCVQRCERQYGSARFGIPYWFLVSEYGLHIDGGIRKDSIWSSIAAIKLSSLKKTPCIVLHYSNKNNPGNYESGSGVKLLFESLFAIICNHVSGKDSLDGLSDKLKKQYKAMLEYVCGNWSNEIEFLPNLNLLKAAETPGYLAEAAAGNITNISKLNGLLEWPVIAGVPEDVKKSKWKKRHNKKKKLLDQGKSLLLKDDPLCKLMENDILDGKAYDLSSNAGSGRPRPESDIKKWIEQQKKLFDSDKTVSDAEFSLKIGDFPDTPNNKKNNKHLTTAKNIVYLYDSCRSFYDTLIKAYPRLKDKLPFDKIDSKVFVYVCNSITPGRLFGDPFTGQIAAYSIAFGKFDPNPRIVVAYYPHQVHTQMASDIDNKGKTLLSELADLLIFHGGIGYDVVRKEFL